MDKIICVGKNYLKHAIELGDPVPSEPVYFLKPPSVLVEAADQLILSAKHGAIHHELELVLKITRHGNQWKFSEFTFGLDLTIRDLQSKLKKDGQPWEKAKVFKNSAVIGQWFPFEESILSLPFSLHINDDLKQQGQGKDMRFQPSFLLKDLEQWFPLCDGDLLFTGTPEGVGPLRDGDHLTISGGPVHFRCQAVFTDAAPQKS